MKLWIPAILLAALSPLVACQDAIYESPGIERLTYSQKAYIKASNAASLDNTTVWPVNSSIQMDGDTMVFGSPKESSAETGITNGTGSSVDTSANAAGAVYVYRKANDAWVQEAYIKAPNAEAGDYFGVSIDLEGDTLVVGASGEDSGASGASTTASSDNSTYTFPGQAPGAVYVYRRSGTTWSLEAYLKPFFTNGKMRCGESVSISGDSIAMGCPVLANDNTAIVNGGPYTDPGSGAENGAVFIYTRTGTTWSPQSMISPAVPSTWFGETVSLDGDLLAVGTNFDGDKGTGITQGTDYTTADDPARSYFGAAFVFARNGTEWSQEAYIKPPYYPFDDFAASISLSGNTLAVGSGDEIAVRGTGISYTEPTGEYLGASYGTGMVFIYNRSDAGVWSFQADICASRGVTYFGQSVDLDGDYLLVGEFLGSPDEPGVINFGSIPDTNGSVSPGSAFLYVRNGTTWTETTYFQPSNGDTDDRFSYSLAIDNRNVAVLSPREDSSQNTITNGSTASDDNSATNSGAVYVFERE